MTSPLYSSGAVGYEDMFGCVTKAFIPALLEAARITAGHRVLDVATGTGAAARAAAELVGPTGEIVAGDISITMLEVARRHPDNSAIKFELLDGHVLPFPDRRFDRVICQLGLAFFEDPARGLTEFNRVLVAGGRAAVAVNSTPDRSLFTQIGTIIGQYVPAKAEQLNRYASIRTIDRLKGLLQSSGFAEVEVHTESRSFSFASFDDYFSGTEAGAGIAGQEYAKLSAETREAVREAARRSFPDAGKRKPFVVEMDVLVGSGNR